MQYETTKELESMVSVNQSLAPWQSGKNGCAGGIFASCSSPTMQQTAEIVTRPWTMDRGDFAIAVVRVWMGIRDLEIEPLRVCGGAHSLQMVDAHSTLAEGALKR